MERTTWREVLTAVTSVVICEAAGLVGSIATFPSIPTWYAGLQKPSFTPPNWLFGPVWTALYALMGVSAYFVWRKRASAGGVKTALSIFGAQLVLNVLWSVTFFGLRSLLGGLVLIVALWVAILLTIITFFRISKTAGVLLIPYILWVSFATALNYSVWVLNP